MAGAGEAPLGAGEALVALLHDPEVNVRSMAARMIPHFGEALATEDVVERLAELTMSPESQGGPFEDVAFEALSQILTFYERRKGIESGPQGLQGIVNRAAEWAGWLTSGGESTEMPPFPGGGLPALKVLRVRLRNIKGYADSEVVDFTDPTTGVPRPWSLLLGENAAGKTTFLRCLALAANGPGLANEVEPRAGSYLRSGAEVGSIEVEFGLQFDPEPSPAGMARVAVGLEIRRDSNSFQPLTRADDDEMSFKNVVRAERFGHLRRLSDRHFGFVCGYGATRGFTLDPTALLPESDKVSLDRVSPMFSPRAPLIDPDVLGKLLTAGDLSNFRRVAPGARLDEAVRLALVQRLTEVLPGLDFAGDDASAVSLDGVRFPLHDLSDGYGSLLALVGHLLYHALIVTNRSTDPTEVVGVVLIDEIDLHLHPSWQRHQARDLGRLFPHMQFIATSHSPMVAGGVPNDALLVLRRGDDGMTVSSQADSVTGWRADQILTSDLFGLSTTRSVEAEKLMTSYALRLNRFGPDDPVTRELGRKVAAATGSAGPGVVDPETDQLLRELLATRFQHLPEEVRMKMLAQASLTLSKEPAPR